MKYKWLKLYCDPPLKGVLSALGGAQYDAAAGKGFEVISREQDGARLRFIERIVQREEIRDPFGNINPSELVRYNSTIIHLHGGAGQQAGMPLVLEIEAPPRSVKVLIGELDTALKGATIAEYMIDPLKIYAKLRQNSRRARVVRIKASKLRVGSDSEMKIEVSSGVDAYADFRKAFAVSSGMIDRIRVDRAFDEDFGQLEIWRNGAIACDEPIDRLARRFFLDYFRTHGGD